MACVWRHLAERNTYPAAGAPDDAALPDRFVVERELEAGTDRHRGRENQTCTGRGEIAHGTIAADPQIGHQDSGALEHPLALCLSMVGRGHADNLRQSDYTLATSMRAEWLIHIFHNRCRSDLDAGLPGTG
jgi:hypothetical protein